MRDNLADTGNVPATGAFWNSPGPVVPHHRPGDRPGARFPAAYANAGPHQSPIRGQANWIYVRVRNRGPGRLQRRLGAGVDRALAGTRVHLAGLLASPTNGPGDPIPSPMVHGTYFIGEAKVTGRCAPGADQTVTCRWPAGPGASRRPS